jgi:hypothetical protein
MNHNALLGRWVYRSLHNIVGEPQQVEDLMLWQAVLTIEDDGAPLIKGRLSAGAYALDVRGAIGRDGDTPTVVMRATGIPGSNTAGWIYDYAGHFAAQWPDAEGQTPAIVGTVTRSVPHGPGHPAGATYSFVAVSDGTVTPYALPQPVIAHFADKVHRLHHAVWHGVRESWDDLTAGEQAKLTALDWQIDGGRVALEKSQKTRPATQNGSGEDFLYFHRQMVDHYRMMMSSLGVPSIDWAELPQPGAGGDNSPDVVPASWLVPEAVNFERRIRAVKSDEFFWSRMRWWDLEFKNPAYLATLTLGELGALLQYTVHNDLHIRWSAPPRDPETRALLPMGRPSTDISDRWDAPAYDWLGEFYSAHVNPVFWRLHGWIDDRIDDWATAHDAVHPREIERAEVGGVKWFQAGRWVQVSSPWVWPKSLGGFDQPMGGDSAEMRARKLDSLTQVMAVLFPPVVNNMAAAGVVPDLRLPAAAVRSSVIGM